MKNLYPLIKFLKFFSILLIFTIGLFVLGHADDARISQPELSRLQPKSQDQFIKFYELFDETSGALKSEVLSTKPYPEILAELKSTYPLYLKTTSARFRSPYQVYAAVGAYPEKTVSRSAIVLKNGDVLKITGINPQSKELLLNFGWIAHLAQARLTFTHATSPTVYNRQPMPKPHDPYGFFYRNFWRYLVPDPEVYQWDDYKIPLPAASEVELSWTCHSPEGGFCLISEPSLWTKADTLKTPKKPNVIMILVDTLRYDGVNPKNTPFLWSLKKHATSYEHTLSSGNHTASAVSSLMTCQQPSHIKPIAFSYFVSEAAKEAHYKKQEPSIGSIFRQNGWDTGLIGSISLFSEVTGVGVDHGFTDQISIERPTYNTAQITRDSILWLDQHKDKPFFLYIHYDGPHGPYRPPIAYGWQSLENWKDLASSQNIRYWLYRSTVTYTDAYIEKLFKALKQLNLYDDSYIVIAADHGDQHRMLSFKGNELGPATRGSLIGHPYTAYDDEIHIPLIFKTPKGGGSPKSTNAITSLLDVAPTLYEGCGVNIPKYCSGVSLHKFNTLGEFGFDPQKRVIPIETDTKNAIIYNNRMKYIRSQKPVHTRLFAANLTNFWPSEPYPFFISEQLFDLESDPYEESDLHHNLNPSTLEARKLYNQFYGIKENFQLALEVTKPSKAQVSLGNKILFEGKITDTKQIPLGQDSTTLGSLRVLLDSRALPVRLSTVGIPLDSPLAPEDLERLPIESSALLPQTGQNSARLYKSWSDDSQERNLSTGNAQFEKLLREWGYLKD